MTTLERINDSLSRGRLNFMEVQKIVNLYAGAHMNDSNGHEEEALKCINKIQSILDKADLGISERLKTLNKERK